MGETESGGPKAKTEAKCFKMNRKSKAASELKSAISNKLRQFLANYSDDVLAEYITVLVCNGKDEYQARDDLEAFLGERTDEFVSWLWGRLSKYSVQSNEYLGTVSDGGQDSAIKIHPHHLLNKDKKIKPLPPSKNIEFVDPSRHHPSTTLPLCPMNNDTVLSKTYPYSGNGSSAVIPADGQQQILCMEKPKKHTVCSDELSYFQKRLPVSRNLQSSTSEHPCLNQICINNVSPSSVGAISRLNGKFRVSVWDRLGKPCENTSARGEIIEGYCVGATKHDKKVLNQNNLMLPVLNAEPCRSMILQVPGHGNCGDISISKCRNMERGVRICEHHSTNNIVRKRHFDEIGSGPATIVVSPVEARNMDHQIKKNSPEPKDSILDIKDSKTTSKLVSQVLDLKLKVHQVEMEMSKLRSKKAGKRNGVILNLSSNSVAVKHPEEDVESRTVYVTNVHFAASADVLSLYFAKCGTVETVAILTNKVAAQPKGSAYVTFASKESVDEAVALSGASFYSRSIKVVRKAEADNAKAVELPLNLSLAPSSCLNRKAIPYRPYSSRAHLQWRRDSNSYPTNPSTPVIVAGKGMNSSSHQQFSSSTLSVRTTEQNSTPPSAAA